jgi:hypothetical protein
VDSRALPSAATPKGQGSARGRGSGRQGAGAGRHPNPQPRRLRYDKGPRSPQGGAATPWGRRNGHRRSAPVPLGAGQAATPIKMSKTGTGVVLSSARLCFHGGEYRIRGGVEQGFLASCMVFVNKYFLSIFYSKQFLTIIADNCRYFVRRLDFLTTDEETPETTNEHQLTRISREPGRHESLTNGWTPAFARTLRRGKQMDTDWGGEFLSRSAGQTK